MKSFTEWKVLKENRAFTGPKEIQAVLNDVINKITKAYPNSFNSIAVDTSPDQISVYQGDPDMPDAMKQKVVQAVVYYLGELGIKFGPAKPNSQDKTIEFPLLDYPKYEDNPKWAELNNPSLIKQLRDGRVLDVADIGMETDPGVWRLTKFVDHVDYYDTKNKAWIQVIVRDKATGEILATIYDRPGFRNARDLLWIR